MTSSLDSKQSYPSQRDANATINTPTRIPIRINSIAFRVRDFPQLKTLNNASECLIEAVTALNSSRFSAESSNGGLEVSADGSSSATRSAEDDKAKPRKTVLTTNSSLVIIGGNGRFSGRLTVTRVWSRSDDEREHTTVIEKRFGPLYDAMSTVMVQQSLNLTSTSVLSNTTDVYQAKGPLQDVALATSGGIRAEDIHTTQSVWPSNEVAAKWPQWVLYDECYPSVVWNSSFSSEPAVIDPTCTILCCDGTCSESTTASKGLSSLAGQIKKVRV